MNNEDKLEDVRRHIRELHKEFRDLQRDFSEIKEELEDKPLTQKERENIAIKGEDGGAPSKDIAKIIKESKVGRGVEVARVENILGKSRKTTLSVMRRMANSYDFLKFRKGRGNKGSILTHAGNK